MITKHFNLIDFRGELYNCWFVLIIVKLMNVLGEGGGRISKKYIIFHETRFFVTFLHPGKLFVKFILGQCKLPAKVEKNQ